MVKKLLTAGMILLVIGLLIKLFSIMVPVILGVGGACLVASLIAKLLGK